MSPRKSGPAITATPGFSLSESLSAPLSAPVSTSESAPPPEARDFTSEVLDVVSQIPPGRAMSYGAVAATLGSRAARQVGKIMAHYGSTVPWWRVVRADGCPPDSHRSRALEHYRSEGTPLRPSTPGGPVRVNMRLAAYVFDEPTGSHHAL